MAASAFYRRHAGGGLRLPFGFAVIPVLVISVIQGIVAAVTIPAAAFAANAERPAAATPSAVRISFVESFRLSYTSPRQKVIKLGGIVPERSRTFQNFKFLESSNRTMDVFQLNNDDIQAYDGWKLLRYYGTE